jgi:hypothetical protein
VTLFEKHFDHVEVSLVKDDDREYILVSPIWRGVDRVNTSGTSCGLNQALAERLKRAIEAGAAYPPVEVCVDVNGQTYIRTDHNVMGRRINADLRRLGF